jgi:hypothetical protein
MTNELLGDVGNLHAIKAARTEPKCLTAAALGTSASREEHRWSRHEPAIRTRWHGKANCAEIRFALDDAG